MKIRFSGEWRRYGVIGYADLTTSIQRVWGGDTRRSPTWRHVTLGLRSPVVRQPARLYKDGKAHYTWHPLRFGWGCGNLYLGIIFIITTFGRQYPSPDYIRFGPLEWAQPGKGPY